VLGIIRIGIDPIAIHVGNGGIHWYGVMYVLAFIAGYRWGVLPHMLSRGATREQCEKAVAYTIVTGLIGARLYYDVQSLDKLHSPLDWIAVWEGGMAFYGAIIAGLATIAFLAWRWRMPMWTSLDAAVLFAVVGQPIGRIGNVINGDILGSPSDAPWAVAYTNPGAILQAGFQRCTDIQCIAYQPAAVYEAIATLIIAAILFTLRRRGARPGILVVTYVALYAVSQLLVFFYRASEPEIAFGLKQAQLTSVVVLLIGVPLLALLRRRFPPREAEEVETAEPAAEPEPAKTTAS
jgi:phosphatidylglycerol:prolipoprotein diacylglycerol transferase